MKHKEIIPMVNKIIYQKTKGFGKILWDLSLDKIESKITFLKKLKNPPHPKLVEGLLQIISAFDTFLDTSSQDSKNDKFCIIGKELFSNVSITPAKDQNESADSLWYGKCKFYFLQILLLKFFRGLLKELYELALVCWYDILLQEPELYSYPQLYYSKEYDIIPIGSIIQEVHIVPKFDKKNCFLLNQYMF
ncbi:4075_t:CDS:2 [Gigaspora margarita]|uniref:4075_t:CDS:1 n=1 Tax=Gigaspora margarita TaxID=4874 RepID=A0ABN7V4Y6_GIGMA|nr:4075_t:CDS:2 [Gigaspora margarita]